MVTLPASCELQIPSLEQWLLAISVHVCCCIGGAIPIGVTLYYVLPFHRLRKLLSLTLGISVAVLTSQYRSSFWIGPFLVNTFGFSTFFKCINVAFQQYPDGADANLYPWLLWFVLLPEPLFAKGKLVVTTTRQKIEAFAMLPIKAMGMFVVLSLLRSNLDEPTTIALPANIPSVVALHLQGYVHVWFVYLWASFCLDFSVALNSSLNVRLSPGFDNPMLEARSLREGWGKRWNQPVQLLLQRTVYIPCRKQGWSRTGSMVATFFASGLLHEYNFYSHNHDAYVPGRATAFFVIAAFVVILESYMRSVVPSPIQSIVNKLPTPLLAMILIGSLSGVMELYFFASWAEAVNAVADLLPHVVCS